jgi:peptidoglycan/LPS O-acetylase OafA/YrhL
MTRTRVNEIDLLRFLASLVVVIYHYAFRGPAGGFSALPYPLLETPAKYGYLGVELFFMISGFVVLMTAANSARLRDFSISRFVRLYPAFWVCCTITYIATIVFDAPQNFTFVQYLFNMTMASDLFGVPLLDGAYWSLLVEIRFYALVAIVLTFGKICQAQRYLMIWLLVCIGLEIFRLFPVAWMPALALHYAQSILIANYAAYFIAGAICFLIWEKGISPNRLAVLVGSWGLAIFQSGVIIRKVESENHMTILNRNVVIATLIVFFLVMLLIALRRTGSIANYRWPLLGAISYPLYLLHQHIGYLVFNRLYPALNAHVLFWGMIVAVLGVAYSVHVLVERKFASRLKIFLTATLASRPRASSKV